VTPGEDALLSLINLEDFEAAARAVLPGAYFDFFAGGAEDEVSVRWNREAYQRRAVRLRILVDVTDRDMSVVVAGSRLPHPIILAPTAYQRLAHPEGEVATALGAAAAGAVMTVSTNATRTLEDIAAAAQGAVLWFQLYTHRDRATTEKLLRRACAAGCQAIVVTGDVPVLGRRERDIRNAFSLPPGVRAANLGDEADRVQPIPFTWQDIAWVKSVTERPVIVKGVVHPGDAARAIEAGADAIWVSNHGGRQLDSAMAPLDALEAIVAVTAGAVSIIVDGGIRRGSDVLKALALGADAIAIGRPQLWGLAVGGSAGVQRVVELLRDELSAAMALAGCRTLADISRDLVT
jgi:4-hydroxymandelate oxidase